MTAADPAYEAPGRAVIGETITYESSTLTIGFTIVHIPEQTDDLALTLHQASRVLEIAFADGRTFRLPYEFLRVYSPSAEVRGHGPGQETLQVGKREVGIEKVEPVGHYAIQPTFSDGHASGIYSWDYLYDLGDRQEELWQRYLDRLAEAGASRDAKK
mgnify:CR=1 FL=1